MAGLPGELIRMMNYVDDIAATLRRINASLYLITPEEKQRLAEYMRKSDPNFSGWSSPWKREHSRWRTSARLR